MKFFFSIAVLACIAFVAGCSSPDEPATPTVTTLVVADTPEKSPEQELIENLWDQQAARPGSYRTGFPALPKESCYRATKHGLLGPGNGQGRPLRRASGRDGSA